jgi:myo-inositol-1-phosphate synthase
VADDQEIPSFMHAAIGGYHVQDIEISAAFDVVSSKVGLYLCQGI